MPKENMLQRACAAGLVERRTGVEELQQNVRETGAVPIRSCEDRQQVELTGQVSTVTIIRVGPSCA